MYWLNKSLICVYIFSRLNSETLTIMKVCFSPFIELEVILQPDYPFQLVHYSAILTLVKKAAPVTYLSKNALHTIAD